MKDTIFYNGEKFVREYAINVADLFPKLAINNPVLVREFKKKEGDFILILIDSIPTIICKKNQETQYQNNISSAHLSFLKLFGELVELLNMEFFENIHLLFSGYENAEASLAFINKDYREKCINFSPDTIFDLNDMAYLGEESDGIKYLYNRSGDVFIYAFDQLMESDLVPISGQPLDTFFTNKKIASLNDILKIVFRS